MKLAIASQDGASMSRHFGRSSSFIVYDIDGQKIMSRHVRAVPAPAPDAPHGHGHLLDAIEGCDTVLCGGMGTHAAEELRSRGINPLVTLDSTLEPDEAVRRLLIGTLSAGWVTACNCKQSH